MLSFCSIDGLWESNWGAAAEYKRDFDTEFTKGTESTEGRAEEEVRGLGEDEGMSGERNMGNGSSGLAAK